MDVNVVVEEVGSSGGTRETLPHTPADEGVFPDYGGEPTEYVDTSLGLAALTTPAGRFLCTTLDERGGPGAGAPTPGPGGDDDGAPYVIPPPSVDAGPPHLRTGPPHYKRTTAADGFPKDIDRFGKQFGGGVNCSESRCYCQGTCREPNSKNPHRKGDKYWCMAD